MAAEAGYTGVELVMGPAVWVRGSGYVARLAAEYGLQVYGVHQALWPTSPQGPGVGRIVDAVQAALRLGCPRVIIHSPDVFRWAEPAAQHWLHALESCQKRMVGSTTRLALENAAGYGRSDHHKVLGQVTLLRDFVERYDLDVTLDTCHAGLQLLDAYPLLRGRLANVHFSDLKPPLPRRRSHAAATLLVHHQMPGEGYLPLGELLSRMAVDGYSGPINMEISPVALRAWSPATLRRRLAQAATYVRPSGHDAQPVSHE